jgi:hypothetical protein
MSNFPSTGKERLISKRDLPPEDLCLMLALSDCSIDSLQSEYVLAPHRITIA